MGLIAGISVFSIIEFPLTIIKSFQLTFCKSKVTPEIDSREKPTKKFLINRDHLFYHLSRSFSEFLKESSIHGVHYINEKASSLQMKVFWFLAVSASMTYCTILVHDSLLNLQSNSVIVALDEKMWNVEDVRCHILNENNRCSYFTIFRFLSRKSAIVPILNTLS